MLSCVWRIETTLVFCTSNSSFLSSCDPRPRVRFESHILDIYIYMCVWVHLAWYHISYTLGRRKQPIEFKSDSFHDEINNIFRVSSKLWFKKKNVCHRRLFVFILWNVEGNTNSNFSSSYPHIPFHCHTWSRIRRTSTFNETKQQTTTTIAETTTIPSLHGNDGPNKWRLRCNGKQYKRTVLVFRVALDTFIPIKMRSVLQLPRGGHDPCLALRCAELTFGGCSAHLVPRPRAGAHYTVPSRGQGAGLSTWASPELLRGRG